MAHRQLNEEPHHVGFSSSSKRTTLFYHSLLSLAITFRLSWVSIVVVSSD